MHKNDRERGEILNCIDFIKGNTKVFGIIGNPVDHSFSPILQNTIAEECSNKMVYVPFPTGKGMVKEAIEGGFALGIAGFNVTVPYKTEVLEALYSIDSLAEQIGAVNTLKRMEHGYKGYNTDILGMEKSLALQGISLQGKSVAVLGAGGAAHAAAILAAARGAKKLFIVNRTQEKASALAEHVLQYYPLEVQAMSYTALMQQDKPEIVFQTTSLGMGRTAGSSPIENPNFFDGIEAVFDIIYTPWETKFLQDAKKAGCVVINGFDMLLFQGIASYEIWNEVEISREKCEKLRNSLTEYYTKRK